MPPALLTAIDASSHVHLIVGANPLAGARCARSLEVGATPKLVVGPPAAPAAADVELHYGLQKRIDDGQVEWIKRDFRDEDLRQLGRPEVDGVVDAVFVTLGRRDPLSLHISSLCRRLRIPVNVADAPNLCTFTLLSTYTDGPLQIGITTSGRGCKLASRIRREVVSGLPPQLGAACERLGTVRRRIWEEDHAVAEEGGDGVDLDADEDDGGQKASFNQLVTAEDRQAARGRRMRWLSQICEYWPLSRLVAITDEDVDQILHDYTSSSSFSGDHQNNIITAATLDARRPSRGHMILAGSGPGHPDLLTRATHRAILTADLILADKLVPAAILALIPRRTRVHLARKFPGNAEPAQAELLQLGLTALQTGQRVVRLKQGDPYLYGRGAEEFTFFASHGFPPLVLPGISSALAAPLLARIPLTHRAVADQILVCTGTGRHGLPPVPPPYHPSQTVVFLMALHRLSALVASLLRLPSPPPSSSSDDKVNNNNNNSDIKPSPWPPSTPCAVIERASCPDQRVVRSSLQFIVAAVDELGSRPPGLLVVGASCGVLWDGAGAGGAKWVVEEGFTMMGGDEGLVEGGVVS